MGHAHSRRRPGRTRYRAVLEALEARNLLSSGIGPAFEPDLPAVALAPVGDRQGVSSPYHDALTGASITRLLHGVDGSGLTVAIIDAGVDYRHTTLGGAFGTGQVVKAGYDFADDDLDPVAGGLQHGTAVAGLIAGREEPGLGLAPGAEVVALRVFDDSGAGDFGAIGDALQWVIDHHEEQGITVVNVSIADGRNYRPPALPDGQDALRIAGLVQQLKARKIPVITASGNSFDGRQGMAFPAMIPETISVSATDAADRVLSESQRLGPSQGGAHATDLLAPGAGLFAPGLAGGYATVEGTSFSAALVSGAVLLLQQIHQARFGVLPEVDALVGWLQAGSSPVFDPLTGITLGRLDVSRAAAQVPSPLPQVPASPVPAPTNQGPAARRWDALQAARDRNRAEHRPKFPGPRSGVETPRIDPERASFLEAVSRARSQALARWISARRR